MQAFTEEMRKALAEEKSPLDACLESVLPGVHQWHHANNAAVSSLRDEMKTMNADIKDGIQQIVGELQEARQLRADQDIQIATLLDMGRQVLLTGKPIEEIATRNYTNNSAPFFTPQRNSIHLFQTPMATTTPTNVNTQQSQDDTVEMEHHSTYVMKPQHKTLVGLLSEWVGVGDFHDEFGGIEGRNKKFGASWRKHFVAFTYSRTERTVKGIRAYAEQRTISDFDACRELQEVFEQRKFSVSNMVNYFKDQGLLTTRKPRGKLNGPRNVSPSTPDCAMLQ